MSALIDVILPVFLVIGFGYAVVALKMFSEAGADSLMRFAQSFAVPCLLFRAVAKLDLSAAYAFVRRDADAVNGARKAIELGGDQARDVILRDQRFQPLASNREFRALFPRQAGGRPPMPMSLQGGALPNLPGMAR